MLPQLPAASGPDGQAGRPWAAPGGCDNHGASGAPVKPDDARHPTGWLSGHQPDLSGVPDRGGARR
ncbi:MAG TPA: hypothetical protein VIQ05_05700, partial [Tardiphaga sp.]